MKSVDYFEKTVIELATLAAIGGFSYLGIELLYRGYTHGTMFFVGGLCFVLVGLINEFFPWDMALTSQMLLASCLITVIEYISGLILNCVLHLNVWDYSHMPYNIHGQVCLLFSIGWFFLSAIAIIVDDILRWKLFNEDKPRYKIF